MKKKNLNDITKKGRLKEQVRNKYEELSNEEKDVKRDYGKNRSRNISKRDKQKLR